MDIDTSWFKTERRNETIMNVLLLHYIQIGLCLFHQLKLLVWLNHWPQSIESTILSKPTNGGSKPLSAPWSGTELLLTRVPITQDIGRGIIIQSA